MAEKLAIYGGPKAKTTPNYPMYPGGLEIGEAEKKEVMQALEAGALAISSTAPAVWQM